MVGLLAAAVCCMARSVQSKPKSVPSKQVKSVSKVAKPKSKSVKTRSVLSSSSPPSQQGNRRRAEILEAATEVFASKSFVGATTRDVGEAAGLLSGSLYHHFDSKETILEEILRPALEKLVGDVRSLILAEGDAATLLHYSMREILRTVFEQRGIFCILHNDLSYFRQTKRFRFVVDLLGELWDLVSETIERAVDEGTFRANLDVEVTTVVILHTIFSVPRWRNEPNANSMNHLNDQFWQLFLNGLKASP
jgi:AcrR family transcriptional regulator